MDKFITLKFFRMEQGRGAIEAFASVLSRLLAIAEPDRQRSFDGVPFWVDNLAERAGVWSGRFCRKQSSNLPPKAADGVRLEPLGVGSIGQTSVWRYHSALSVMVFKSSRGGVGLPQFLRYIRDICECRGYAGLPLVSLEDLRQLQDNRIRGLNIKVACPQDLQHVSSEQTAVSTGMATLMNANVGTHVEVRYSLAVGDPDIVASRISPLIRFFRREKEAGRGEIKKVEADLIGPDGISKSLDFLESHMVEREELDLPDDDPDLNYSRRRAFAAGALNRKLGELETLFGDG